jgi:hypothetical protein
MGCVHTHQRILAIEEWGNRSHIWSDVEKIREASRKFGKIDWNVNQTLTHGPKHDRIWTWWVLDIPSESMLERVWWCKHFQMESWSWTICCLMSYSNKGKHVQIVVSRKSHIALKCCWKRKVLLSTHAKASRRKWCWSTINLKTMIRAQILK